MRYLKSTDRLKTRNSPPPLLFLPCVQASPFIPRQTRSPFTPIESRPFLRDPRFFRFVESSYTQYPTQRASPTSWHERLLPGRLRIPGAVKFQRRGLTSEVRVACWRCTWAVVPHRKRKRERNRERGRELSPPPPPLAQCYTLARGTRE